MTLVRIARFSAALLVALPAAFTTGLDIAHNARVAGGKVAPSGDFQFVAYIEGYRNDADGSICTGSLIAPNVVLTAAHCTISPEGFTYEASQIHVSFSHTPNASDVLTSGYTVSKIKANTAFDMSTLRNDVALLILDKHIPTSVATPAKIYSVEVDSGTQLTAAGYGLTVPGDEYSYASQLMEVSLIAATQEFCASRNDLYDVSINLCTDDNTGRRVCPGDSGGPLSIQSGDGYAIVGITDYISVSDADTNVNKTALELCSEENSGSFFTRASAYINWIAKTANLDTSDFTTTIASAAESDSGSLFSDYSADDSSYDDASAGGKDGDGSLTSLDPVLSGIDEDSSDSSAAAALVSGMAPLPAVLGISVTLLSVFL
ncbi:hypothetical protein EV175_005026 [Coemansia sp. RSA 1933]|nr:hypothetical protein EV175_005026 [Coemansia sp. RSA 1933]